jgi:transposase
MRFIELTSEEQQHLTLLYKTSDDHRERQRAHALLLSARRYSISDLAELFDLDRDTISRWMNRWQEWLADTQKAPDLRDQRRSGRPAVLSADQKKA